MNNNTITFLPLTSSQISTDNGTPTKFSITNHSNAVLELYWVDRAGQLQPYGKLAPGERYQQSTLSTHVWEVKSTDGNVGFKFAPTYAGNIDIGSSYQPTFTDYSEKVIQTSNGLWSSAQGYGLIDVAKSLGVADVLDLPMNGQNNNLALNAINAPAAWAAGYTGKGVKVAVIDVGIANNPEVSSKIVAGYDFNDNDTNPQPDGGAYRNHALGVAAIIAASHDPHAGRDTMGVAPDVSLINVRVGNSQFGSSPENIAAGIRYAVDQGAKVICMPLESASTQLDKIVADAVHYAYQHNVVTVIIGGNYGSYGPTGPALIAQQLKGEVIDVGNFNVMAGAPFDSSNMPGDTPFPWVMASSSGYVPTSDGSYNFWEDGGTSFAGPYVAGLAALLWQQNPNATATEIINKILAGATVGENAATANMAKLVTGSASADVFKAAANTNYDGGAGIDTVQYSGAHTGYAITATATGFTVTSTGDHTSNQLIGVERLAFSDTAIALDINGNGGETYRLYQAAFGRTPDAGGLGFWINALDSGMTLTAVTDGFVKSAEFQQLYGANPTSTQLVTAMYHNVLHRDPDAGGLSFWLDAMDNHGVTTKEMLVSFSESTENQAAVAKIIGQGFAFEPYHA